MKSLLVVTHIYPPEMSGGTIRLKNMVDRLRGYGYKVDVLSAIPNYPTGKIFPAYKHRFSVKEEEDGGSVYRYWIMADNSMNKVKRLLSIISYGMTMQCFGLKIKKCRGYDGVIVQTPQLISAMAGVFLFNGLYKKKIILNVSDIHPNSIEDGGSFRKDGFLYKYQRWIEKYLYRHTTLLLGQSQEILDHVREYIRLDSFLYRNLQSMEGYTVARKTGKGNKLVYAGLLSKTQGVVDIIKSIDFHSLGLEFHVYGEGVERPEIEKLCDEKSIFYHGQISNSQMFSELQKYDASIVTLARPLKGAVPSKIYNVVAAGLPVLYIGKIDGEAAKLIREHNLGMTAPTGDYQALYDNLHSFSTMEEKSYLQIVNNCLTLSRGAWNLEHQAKELSDKINEVI